MLASLARLPLRPTSVPLASCLRHSCIVAADEEVGGSSVMRGGCSWFDAVAGLESHFLFGFLDAGVAEFMAAAALRRPSRMNYDNK